MLLTCSSNLRDYFIKHKMLLQPLLFQFPQKHQLKSHASKHGNCDIIICWLYNHHTYQNLQGKCSVTPVKICKTTFLYFPDTKGTNSTLCLPINMFICLFFSDKQKQHWKLLHGFHFGPYELLIKPAVSTISRCWDEILFAGSGKPDLPVVLRCLVVRLRHFSFFRNCCSSQLLSTVTNMILGANLLMYYFFQNEFSQYLGSIAWGRPPPPTHKPKEILLYCSL
jgi:hypothetical protein